MKNNGNHKKGAASKMRLTILMACLTAAGLGILLFVAFGEDIDEKRPDAQTVSSLSASVPSEPSSSESPSPESSSSEQIGRAHV